VGDLLGSAGTFVLIAGLLVLSGVLSASETAIFSLTQQTVATVRPVATRRVLERLLANRQSVLVGVLFCDLLVNMSCFAVFAVLADGLSRSGQHWLADAMPLVAVVAVIIVGEVIPKLLAVRNPVLVAGILAWPLSVLMLLVAPARILLAAVAASLLRLLTGPRRPEGELAARDLEELLRVAAGSGEIAADERERLHSVVMLSRMQVREIMLPRVRMVTFELRQGREALLALASSSHHNKFPVHDGDPDGIHGWLDAKEVAASPAADLRELVRPVDIVPELARVAVLVPLLVEARKRLLLVVDEYGGTAGMVTHADLEHAVLGDMQDEGDTDRALILRQGNGEYSVDGILGVTPLHVLVGLPEAGPPPAASVGGIVMARLDRIPVTGDQVRYAGMLLTVQEVRRYRPVRVLVQVPLKGNRS
jgi:CBS domain containing-hemolysin-like protein